MLDVSLSGNALQGARLEAFFTTSASPTHLAFQRELGSTLCAASRPDLVNAPFSDLAFLTCKHAILKGHVTGCARQTFDLFSIVLPVALYLIRPCHVTTF